MANAFSLYFDSVGHRVCEMVSAHPTVAFSLGQIRAAADVPYRHGKPPALPDADTVTTGQRSITSQLNRLITAGLLIKTTNPITGRIAYMKGPTPLHTIRILDYAGLRPGMRPNWHAEESTPPTPAAAAADPFIL